MADENYFKRIFTKTKMMKDISKIMTKNRKIQRYSSDRHCSTDMFCSNYMEPLTLKNTCLKFLHYNITLKYDLVDGFTFINNVKAPHVICNLRIPLCLKYELLLLFVNCPRHVNLVDYVPKRLLRQKFFLDHNSLLFSELQKSDKWDKSDNYRVFSISELVNLVIIGRNINTNIYGSVHFGLLVSYVKSACKSIWVHEY